MTGKKKIFGEGQVKAMLSEYTQGKISFGKFVELLNELASAENGCLESKLAERNKMICNADCPDVEFGNCDHPSNCQKMKMHEINLEVTALQTAITESEKETANLRRAIAIVCNSIPPAKRDQLFGIHAEEFNNLIK